LQFIPVIKAEFSASSLGLQCHVILQKSVKYVDQDFFENNYAA